MTSGIGAVDQAVLPAEIRTGTTEQRDAYKAALGFERQLVEQLAKQLTATTNRADDAQASAATGAYRDQLPGALADAVVGAGGLGLAAQIAASLAPAGERTAPQGDTSTGAVAA